MGEEVGGLRGGGGGGVGGQMSDRIGENSSKETETPPY